MVIKEGDYYRGNLELVMRTSPYVFFSLDWFKENGVVSRWGCERSI